MPKRFVLHQARNGKYDRFSVFDILEMRDIKGGLSKHEAVELMNKRNRKPPPAAGSTQASKKKPVRWQWIKTIFRTFVTTLKNWYNHFRR